MIDFKSYLIEDNQSAIVESVADFGIVREINTILFTELEKDFLTPQAGFEVIRRILNTYDVDMPVVFGLDNDGDETVLDVSAYGNSLAGTLLYVLYSLSDEGYYEFYAELTDDAGIEKLLESGTEEEVEEK